MGPSVRLRRSSDKLPFETTVRVIQPAPMDLPRNLIQNLDPGPSRLDVL